MFPLRRSKLDCLLLLYLCRSSPWLPYILCSLVSGWCFWQHCLLCHTTRHSITITITFYILHFTAWAGYPNSLLIFLLFGRLIIILSHFLLIIQCGTLIIPSTPSFWLASLEFYYLILHLLLILLY